MYMQALKGYEEVWGPEHTSALHTVNNMTRLYCKLVHQIRTTSLLKYLTYKPQTDKGMEKVSQQILINCVHTLVQYPSAVSSSYGHLGRVLMGLHDANIAATAVEQQLAFQDNTWQHRDVVCDSCTVQLDLHTGRLVCKHCFDRNLFRDCYAKYELDEIQG